MIRGNLAATFLGGIWNAIVTLAVTPILIAILGVESFGLISMIAVLQVVVSAFDFGLAVTVTRQVAHTSSPQRSRLAGLLAALATVYWLMTLVIAGALWFGAELFVDSLIKTPPQGLTRAMVVASMRWIALYLALRWPVAFYAGVISGAQRLDVLNAIKSAATTLRLAGGAGVLFLVPDLERMLQWYVLVAALELISSIWYARRLVPMLSLRPSFQWSVLGGVWKFSAAMYTIALLSILLTQIDRLAVSRMLGLQALGYYSVAYNLAIGLSLIQTAINTTALPAFAEANGQQDRDALLRRYVKFSQLMALSMTPAALALVFFGRDVLTIWISSTVATAAWQPLALLATGFLLNGMFSNVYTLAVACEKPALFLRANLIGLAFYVPLLLIGLAFFGVTGAALAWLVLNVYYLAVVLPRAHAQLELMPAGGWMKTSFGVFVAGAAAAFATGRLLATGLGGVPGLLCGVAFAGIGYLVVSYRCLHPAMRADVHHLLRAAAR